MSALPHLQGDATLPVDDSALTGLATAVGVVGPASATALAAFFVADGPFGSLNDVGNAVLGLRRASPPSARPPVR